MQTVLILIFIIIALVIAMLLKQYYPTMMRFNSSFMKSMSSPPGTNIGNRRLNNRNKSMTTNRDIEIEMDTL